MRRVIRGILVAGTLAIPFAVTGPTAPASATCRPEKPSTCEMYCPSGDWVYAGPVKVCVPLSDDIALDLPELP